jgi:hypothetical protein
LTAEGDEVLVEYLSPLSAHVHYAPSEREQHNQLEIGFQQLTVQYDVDRSINPAGDIMVRRKKFTLQSRATLFCLYYISRVLEGHFNWLLANNKESIVNLWTGLESRLLF